jgi:hypothetical protein
MAWAVKYRLEIADNNGANWKVDIEEDSFAGEITTLQGTGNPILIEWNNDSDDVFEPIKSSHASINVYSTTNFALMDLIATQDMQFRMVIYQGEVEYWKGYIITNNYQEPYDVPPYPVTITACCGLELLENYHYCSSETVASGAEAVTYYEGRRLESQIILDILGKISYTGFREYVNIYEESMASTVGDSPMDQLKIDVDIFKDKYCDEVLREVLKKYNACIVHKGGEFYIYRPVELTGATVYGRIFTAVSTKTATTLTPEQFINRSTNISNRRQVSGGMMIAQAPAKTVKIFQDYGNKDSWIENWEFKPDTYNPYTLIDPNSWKYWTGTVDIITNEVPEEPAGALIYGEGSERANSITQEFGTHLKATNNVLAFSFEYYFYNYSGGALADIYVVIKIKPQGSNHWATIKDDEDLEWNTVEDYIAIPNASVAEGRSGWITFSRAIPDGLPTDGPYDITLYNPYSASTTNLALAFRNVRLYSTSDVVQMKKRPHHGPFPKLARWLLGVSDYVKEYVDRKEIFENEYVVANAIDGERLEYNMKLGDVTGSDVDNVIEQFAGSLATILVTYREDTIVLTGTDGRATVSVNGVNAVAVFQTDLATTAANFVSVNASLYDAAGITLTADSATLSFVGQTLGKEFTGDSTITNLEGDLSGNVTEGAATNTDVLAATSDWNTRGGSESKELLEIIGDEIADQYSRPKQLVQMSIQDTGTGNSAIDIVGNFQDDLNQISAANRKFVFNRGSFDVKMRRWDIDLMEII